MKRTRHPRLNDAATQRILRLLHLAARISEQRGISLEGLCHSPSNEKRAKTTGENAEGAKRQNEEVAP